MGQYNESHGPLKLYVYDQVVAEGEIRTMTGHFSLCGEGLCVGYDSSDTVSSEYGSESHFTGGTITKVVFDVADDAMEQWSYRRALISSKPARPYI